MVRRIIVHNEFARALDAREGVKRVAVGSLRVGDMLTASGERVTHNKPVAEERQEVRLLKNGYPRVVYWARDAKVVIQRDGVGTPEEVAFGEGWHSQVSQAPYAEPALRSAWERGRAARKQKQKLNSNYRHGELRNKKFEAPRVRQVDTTELEDLLQEASRLSENSDVRSIVEVLEWAEFYMRTNANVRPRLLGVVKRLDNLVTAKEKKLGVSLRAGSRDFKSEKGYVAKLIDVQTGKLLAKSEPHISNGEGLKRWIQTKAQELIRAGKRVKSEVAVVFFDPNLVN